MEKREKAFQRNEQLEKLLKEINTDLDIAEKKLICKNYKKYPIILIMGAPRSGTTLTMQWLANTGQFAYPTNLMSRFYQVPIIGAKIQKLLLDPSYNFRDEIIDFPKEISYISQNGKTKGALAPNEFWYFWRRFFPFEKLEEDYLTDKELDKIFDKEGFIAELMGIANVFEKPLVLKGMIANYNIGFLSKILEQVIFVYLKREQNTNVESLLEARKRQLGDIGCWYSFRIPEKKELLKIKNPVAQVEKQIYYINKAIGSTLDCIAPERKLEINYEEFCKDPEKYYFLLRDKLIQQGYYISNTYYGEKNFLISRKISNK